MVCLVLISSLFLLPMIRRMVCLLLGMLVAEWSLVKSLVVTGTVRIDTFRGMSFLSLCPLCRMASPLGFMVCLVSSTRLCGIL
uniref:Uncharacterized protein n=1 Tax=Picea glauca TaxID=3330 RepID=A0A101M2S7_PICGL|nr:hypothetical protein ABT39_MTgene3224 [Picea glauca]QHR90586.1 hypothetical protein Q903MT_gene4611 [Picea sitchensis]